MSLVLDALDPLIQKEVNRWSGAISRGIVETQAKRLAAEAVESYDPRRGASLATHVSHRLMKLSRLLYTHQNVARVPEYQTMQFHTFTGAQAELEDKHGRPPTVDEMADRLGWSKARVSRLQRSMRNEFVESGDPLPMFDDTRNDSYVVAYVYNDMNPEQKKLFEYTTGYGGTKVLSSQQIMQRMGWTQGQLSYKKRQLIDLVDQKTGGGVN